MKKAGKAGSANAAKLRVSLSPGAVTAAAKPRVSLGIKKGEGDIRAHFLANKDNENQPNQHQEQEPMEKKGDTTKASTTEGAGGDTTKAQPPVATAGTLVQATAKDDTATQVPKATNLVQEEMKKGSTEAEDNKEATELASGALQTGAGQGQDAAVAVLNGTTKETVVDTTSKVDTTMGPVDKMESTEVDNAMDEDDVENVDDVDISMEAVDAPVGNKRNVTKFLELVWEVTNVAGQEASLELAARQSFLKVLKALGLACIHLLVLKFKAPKNGDPNKFAILVENLDKDLPTKLTELTTYALGLRVEATKTYTVYATVKVAFQTTWENFSLAAKAQMDHIGAKIYEAPLQFADTVTDGYIAGGHAYINLKSFVEKLIFQSKVIALTLGTAPIPMAAKRKQVWDGIKKADRPPGWKATFAIHILFCRHQAAAGRAHLKRILIWYNKMGFLNYNIRYIQCLNPRDMMDSAITKNHRSRAWHC
jgi:hypothetical protein